MFWKINRRRQRHVKRRRSHLIELLEQRFLLTAYSHNYFEPFDVNNDNNVWPLDVLIVINELDRRGSGLSLATNANAPGPSGNYVDVNGDGRVSTLDVSTALDFIKGTPPLASNSVNGGGSMRLAEGEPPNIDRSMLVSVDSQIKVSFSGVAHNPRTRQSKTNVIVTNVSGTSIDTPLILVIESISDPTVTVSNTGWLTMPDGKPLFDLSGQVPGTTLDPSEATNTRPLMFNNPNLKAFTVRASVYRQLTTPATPNVTFEIPADSYGRKFIGVGEGLDITLRADGTAPVTIDLGQKAAATGSRGVVFFGNQGSDTTATVTTSGGTNNVAQIRVRGDAAHPSGFQGDLDLTASVGGTQVATERVTVLKIELDQFVVSLQNDRPVLRTITSIPPTPNLNFDFDFFRSGIQGSVIAAPFSTTTQSLNIYPVNASVVTTGANGVAQFLVQQGAAGQGWTHGAARVVYASTARTVNPPEGPGSTTETIDGDAGGPCECCECFDTSPAGSTKASSGESTAGANLTVTQTRSEFSISTQYRSQVSQLRSIMGNDFGVDWGISYISDRLVPDGNNVIRVSPSVRTEMFVATPTPGRFLAPIQNYGELTINVASDLELRNPDGTVKTYERFSDPQIPGRLVRIEDRNGNFTTFHYAQIDPDVTTSGDEKYVLAYVIDDMGREIRFQYYARTSQIVAGRPLTITDPAAAVAAWGRLARIVDFKGDMDFDGVATSQDFPGQSNNRTWRFDYDSEANLIAMTTPAVTGTPNGNDFVDGKTTRYDYLREADIPVSITGVDRQRLLHNMTEIQAPSETALNPANAVLTNPREILVYGLDPIDTTNFDRVLSNTIGGINDNEVPAGGTITYQYQILATDAMEPNDPYLKTTVTDRNGSVNQYVFSSFDTLLEKRELTRGFRTGEPSDYVTRYQYNLDKQLLQTVMPDGNVINNSYSNSPDRSQQGNRTSRVFVSDLTRGGDQTSIAHETVYEPIYQQLAAEIDPRGLDAAYTPTIPDPSGRTLRDRFTTNYFYDYQEGNPAFVLPLLAAELRTTVTVVQERLAAAGVQLGLGDLNGDGDVTPRISGDMIRMEQPSVVLLAGSNQASIEGDQLQEIVTLYRYDRFGNLTSVVDPEGNVTTYSYFPETDPDGDGVLTPPPADGRTLDAITGGYLKEQVRDTGNPIANPNRNNRTNPTPTNISTRYAYDDVGNTISVTDGRGIRTDFFVNELNQTVQTSRAAAVPASGPGQPDEPLPLTAFAYVDRVFYDWNDNVVLTQTEDRGNTSQVDGNPPTIDLPTNVPGVSNPDPVGGKAFVDNVFKYDILDNRLEMLQEVANGLASEFLHTRYRYDPNQNQVLTIQPEGNATAAIYDERDLLFRSIRGARTPAEHDPDSPAATAPTLLGPGDSTNYDVRGGADCQCTTVRYDGNRNVITTVDGDDTDLSPANNDPALGTGDRTRFIYDGFDRRTSVIDSLGNQTVYQYDPAGNVIRTLRFGPVGGTSPTSDGPNTLLMPVSSAGVIQSGKLVNANLLAATESQFDELGRSFQTDQVLFVNTIPTQRPPDVADGATSIGKGNLTPGDNQTIPGVGGVTIVGRVSERTEYDRLSRPTFYVEDDTDTYRTDYDGANRTIKTLDPVGNMVALAYDGNSNVIETSETDVSQVPGIPNEVFLATNFYDSLNRRQRSVDNLGQTSNYRYDSRGNLAAMADAQGPLSGVSISRRAFANGALTINFTNHFGNVTRYVYDGLSRQTRQEVILTGTSSGDGIHSGASIFGVKDDPLVVESFTPTPDAGQAGGDGIIRSGTNYDRNSLLSSLLDDNGNVTLYLYDNLNRLVTETKGLTVNTTPLDKAKILGPREIVTPKAATINNPAVIPASKINTQLAAAKARLDAVSAFFASLADRVDDNPPTTIVYGYSPEGNLLILEDENDSETFTKYDALNRPIAQRVFRSEGNPATQPPDNFVGDSNFAPAPVSDPKNPSSTFPAVVGTNRHDYQYDGLSRLVRGTDNNDPVDSSDDSAITNAYDSLGRRIEETQQIGELPAKAISSSWRSANLRSQIVYPNNRMLVYTYDVLDRLNTVTDQDANLSIADYDYIGTYRVLVRANPQNGTRMTYLDDTGTADTGYDGLRRPVELRHLRSDNSLVVGFTYTYNRMNGKLTEGKLHDPTNSDVFGYDSGYRLTDFNRPSAGAIAPLHSDWTLDGLGNWQSVVSTETGVPVTETRQHSSFNEITQRSDGGVTTILSDDNGNQTDDGTFTFQWDHKNLLRTVTRKSDGMLVASYSYDAANRRTQKVVLNSDGLNGTTDFYYDGWQSVEYRDNADTLIQQYVFGVYIDEALVIDHGPSAQRYYAHANHLYSVAALTDAAGQVVERYIYDAYGIQTITSPTGAVRQKSAVGFDRGFTGYIADQETGLLHARARQYSPTLGRFVGRDPLGYVDGSNLYRACYVPNGLDPYGLAKFLAYGGYGYEDGKLVVRLKGMCKDDVTGEICPLMTWYWKVDVGSREHYDAQYSIYSMWASNAFSQMMRDHKDWQGPCCCPDKDKDPSGDPKSPVSADPPTVEEPASPPVSSPGYPPMSPNPRPTPNRPNPIPQPPIPRPLPQPVPSGPPGSPNVPYPQYPTTPGGPNTPVPPPVRPPVTLPPLRPVPVPWEIPGLQIFPKVLIPGYWDEPSGPRTPIA